MTESSQSEPAASGSGGAGPPADEGRAGWKLSLFLCLLIALAGAMAIWVIFRTEPTATRAGATKETAMLVDVTRVRTGTHRPTLAATGTVRPSREIVIRPRVEGRVTDHASGLVPGGLVSAGTTLVSLDDADYRQALRQRRSDVARARAELRMEQGQQRVAEEEYRLADPQLQGENRALALRQPQLDVARARVASAEAAVEQARLQLQRTSIEAPFEAQVLSREIDIGSQVSAGDALARLVGTDTYWVRVTLPVSKLRWLRLPDGNSEGAAVALRNPGAWPDGAERNARVFRLVGSLDDSTRMARVLVAVDDPLARDAATGDAPRLLLGSYVEAHIRGAALEDVVRLDRRYVRRGETVWVMSDGKLDIREVDIAVSDSQHAYIRDGLTDGDRVVTSSLATIRDGAPLRLERETTADRAGGA